MEFLIEIAGTIIEIHSIYKLVYFYCRKYCISGSSSDIKIWTTLEEIESERIKIYPHIEQNRYKKSNLKYINGEVESLIILRKISEKLLSYSTILMHGTVISDGDYGYMITAPSGTGKTTRARKLISELDGAKIINGDKPFIKIDNNGEITIYGTPWCGKEFINSNESVPLHTIFLLERSQHTKIEKVSFYQALPFLLQQTHAPLTLDSFKKTVSLLSVIGKSVQIIRYKSRPDASDILDAYYTAKNMGLSQTMYKPPYL